MVTTTVLGLMLQLSFQYYKLIYKYGSPTFFSAILPVTELRRWNIEHLSLLPVRSLPPSSTTIPSNRKWLGPRSHRKSMSESEKEPTSPGAQCNFFWVERHYQRSTRLCHRTCPKDSVQFNRMLNKNLRKLLLSTKFYRVLPKEN